MRKLIPCILVMLSISLCLETTYAQTTVTLGTGTSSGATNVFVSTSNTTNKYSYNFTIYSASDILAAGGYAGIISKLAWDKQGTGEYTFGDATFNVYLKHVNYTQHTTTTETWASIISGATLVYSSSTFSWPTGTGWKDITLQNSFNWNGSDNVAVLVDWYRPSSLTANINWTYTTTTNANKWRIGTTPLTDMNQVNSSRANIQMTFDPNSACTSPPTPGDATASLPTVCSGNTVNLGLTNNSNGIGQTYQWQSATSVGGTYSNIGSSSNSYSLTINPTATLYYRCAVTCGGSTTYSTPVVVTVPPLISGTFTINSNNPTGSGNFQTFTEAINSLSCGIGGKVIFNVEPGSGPYLEQITIPAISGASATNTITFHGNGAVIEASAPVTATRHVIKLDGADYVTIDSLDIRTTATGTSAYGWGVHFINGANYDTIKNCIISIGSTSTTQSNSGGIVMAGSTSTITTDGSYSYNVIQNNTITGGYQGIIINGTATSLNAVGNKVLHNKILDFYANGMEFTDTDSLVVSGNDISRPARTTVTTGSGMEIGSGNKRALINANRIHNTHGAASGSTTYGIYSNACDAPAGQENRYTNNLLYNFNGTTGTIYGIYSSSSDGSFYYNNTIVLDNTAATAGITRGFYQLTAATRVEFKNNIVVVNRGGSDAKYCLYFGTTTSTIVSNNNVLYNVSGAGTNGIGYFGAGFTDITAWKGANSAAYDQASVSIDPLFTNSGIGDYTPFEPSLNNIGDNSVGVTTDILGAPRGSSPDPGAYEFNLGGCTNPPVAGTAITTLSVVCPGEQFILDLTGNSTGDNQTYQWQASADGINGWANMGTAQTTTTYTATQAASMYYRAEVKCSGGTPAYSTIVHITSPASLVAGNYTINNAVPTGSGNFASFTDAVAFIKCGINGPVVFNVVPGTGPYNEQVIMRDIPGTSAVNTITFNGNGATLHYLSVSASERAVFKLYGTDHVIIDSLNIIAEGFQTTEYGYGIQLVDNADYNTIRKCTITSTMTPATAASTNFAGIVINASTATTPLATGNSLCDSNTIIHNTIIGGYCGIAVTANGITSTVNANNIINNKVSDYYIYGITVNGNQHALISGNELERPTRNSIGAFYGIDVNGAVALTITKNKIHDSHTGNTSATTAAYGIYHSVSDAIGADANIVSNNMIYGFNNSGTQYALYNSGSDGIRYLYNSILLDNPGSTTATYDTRGLYQTTAATGLEIRNNIIVISRAGSGENHCLYFNTAATTYTSDNNNLYMTSANGSLNNVVYHNPTQYTSLSAWQAATSTPDQHSWSIDPMFVSNIDLHLTAATPLDDKGAPVAGVTDDFDGDVRSAGSPDIGADELPPAAGIDIKPELLVSPAISAKGCYNTETVKVRIKNNSVSAIDFTTHPVTVSVGITGVITTTLTATVNTGTLASAATQEITLAAPSSTINMSVAGQYQFTIITSVTGDVNTGNDMLFVTRDKADLMIGTINATPDSYCLTGGTPVLTETGATGYTSILWQQSTGTSFSNINGADTSVYNITTPITQTMYYRLTATCGTTTIMSDIDSVVLNNPQILTTAGGFTCGTGTVTLNATGTGSVINWYANSTGGLPVGNGNSYTTPMISNNTTYYVTAGDGGSTGYTAKPAPAATETTWNLEAGLRFDAYLPFTLVALDIYPQGTGVLTIDLKDASQNVLNTTTVNINNGTTAVMTIPIGFNILPGTGYFLSARSMSGSGISGMLRGTSGVTFPYTLPTICAVTSGYLTTNLTSTTYYYFYNWQVSTGCESPRVPVLATVNNDPGCTPTPVSLLTFTGVKNNNVNVLNWSTANEVNNAGFALQRSADGVHFGELTFITSKAINGNSNSELKYSFMDEKPFAAGKTYYRLKQTDKDGKGAYSNIIALDRGRSSTLELVTIYPNPAKDKINLKLIAPKADKVTVIVTDVTGKTMSSTTVSLTSGENVWPLNIQPLAQGSYFVKVVCTDGCETAIKRFVKE